MLVKFSVSNYLSIREKQEIHFLPSSIKELIDSNIAKTAFDNLKLLKSIGIFGPNSSGKSNILKSLYFVKKFIIESSIRKQSNQEISVKPFLLNKEYAGAPSHFEVEFLLENLIYRYELIVSKSDVHKESLYYKKKKKEFLLFSRTGQVFELGVKLGGVDNLKDKTRHNASFLSVLAQFNSPLATKIVGWFNKVRFLKDEFSNSLLQQTAELYKDKKYRLIIERILKNADLGFQRITTPDNKEIEALKDLMDNIRIFKGDGIDSLISRFNIKAIHNVYDNEGNIVGEQELDISVESMGTQKYFSMIGRIAEILSDGGVLVIDEIDARLHSFLCESIIHYFNSHTNNPHDAQLIFVSHNSFLMRNKLLRRDQIYITDKDILESTTISSLMDQKVRYDVNFEKAYLEKKIKGVPIIDTQLDLFIGANKNSQQL